MFEKITIKAMNKDGWLMDFQLKPKEQPAKAIEWLEANGYAPAEGSGTQQSEGLISFPAEQMTATVDKGKTYWKVTGGSYQKFGVIVWPEVLAAAGIDERQIDIRHPFPLTGFTAHCLTKPNGKPKKVIRLEWVTS